MVFPKIKSQYERGVMEQFFVSKNDGYSEKLIRGFYNVLINKNAKTISHQKFDDYSRRDSHFTFLR